MARSLRWSFLFVSLLSLTAVALAQADDGSASDRTALEPDQWLALSAVVVRGPALADSGAADDPFASISLPLRSLAPSSGDRLAWPGRAESLRWETLAADGGVVDLGAAAAPTLRVLTLRLETDVLVKGGLTLRTAHRARAFLDGERVLSKDAATAADTTAAADAHATDASVTLEPGTHRLIVMAAADSAEVGEWTLGMFLEVDAARSNQVRWSVDPTHRLGATEFLDMDAVTGISVSRDGEVVAIGMRSPQAPSEKSRSWVDFLSTDDGRVLWSLEGVGELAGLEWAPAGSGRRYAFITREKGKATIWLAEFSGGPARILLEDVEDLGRFRWMPDGSGLIYTVSEEGEKDPEDVKRYRGLTDRWSGSRQRSFLHHVAVPSGVVRRLTAGDHGTSLQDIAPEGDALLFTRTIYEDSIWPFSRDELFELVLEDLTTRKLTEAPGGVTARYSPDGRTILLTSSPSSFGEGGENVPEGRVPNLYDTQAYLMDRRGGEVRPITREFAPSIEEVAWSRASGDIVARTTDRSQGSLYVYDVDRDRWRQLPTPLEVVERMTLSADGHTLVFEGNSTNTPWRVYAGSVRGAWRPRLVQASGLDVGGVIRTGRVESFDFEHGEDTIVGRVYYPPHFDPERKWPAIVYYYGGTVPVTRDFGGRYPKELWAAHGYVVYVLQPSGATGFGQEFSSRHVNNWGVTVADEIIAGTKAFLAAHDFVDAERVGCIGASYGGFMTMLLTTRTDIYAAAVSHAGISSLSSYWGEGNWGYIYSAAATAHSYPWNRPDLYVDQSPLFAADRVVTPLLLLHGGDDDNVPPGESEQMYTALRVLGKEVEYVRIAGERHWILQYDKRMLWTKTIISWFDRWLKDEPEWWEHLYEAGKD